MNFQIFSLILICLFIFLPNSHQLTQLFGKSKTSLESIIFISLNYLQQKLTNGTFTNEDMFVLSTYTKFIFEKKELLERERKKQHTVYWLTRQGR